VNSHDSICKLVTLAAADALSHEEMSRVEQHAETCPECRRELEVLRLYSRGLRELTPPVAPAGLLQRTRARLEQERAARAERRWHDLTLSLLALFSWASGIVFWVAARFVTGEVWKVFGTNVAVFGTWSLLCAVLVWTTAGVAVVVLRNRSESARRIL